ncbi:MAG: DUF4153 domain-containing protein [Anaerobacillus sp.]|uniref:DUF4153 domain-containing protein n=1 Tax=Anaerobacillus sp. TaxID=1872506 RepID=UPI00391909D3
MKTKKGWTLLTVCIFLAVLVEVCLLRERVGISYTVFILVFYTFFFYHFRIRSFQNKQISDFFFITIWLLALSFAVYSNPFFEMLNSLLIPLLVFVHTIMLTSSTFVHWYSKSLLSLLVKKLAQMLSCSRVYIAISKRQLRRKVDRSTYQIGKKVAIGVLLSIPLLFIIISLLSAADAKFTEMLQVIPEMFLNLETDVFWNFLKIGLFTIAFHCYFKVVNKRTIIKEVSANEGKRNWDTITITTILIFVNFVYLLFAIVQFQYLFSGTLQAGFSFAEYARRGFFELIFVTMINYCILISTISFIKNQQSKIIKTLLTFLIVFSTVLLSSAYVRMMLYEQAYGFTSLRFLVYTFMVFLMIILAYTLVKVWITRLPLMRFYIIAALVYYLGLNLIGIDQWVVSKNIERYETTGNIDLEYVDGLSYSAIPPLVELNFKHPDIVGLEALLVRKQEQISQEKVTWQSFNLSRERAKKALGQMQ